MADTMTPNPGSKEAIEQGCTCPVYDNAHGKGIPFDGETCFWYDSTCNVHGVPIYTVYKCSVCAFQTTDKERLEKHIDKHK